MGAEVDDRIPIAATDNRDVDYVDVTGWGVFKGHAIPVAVARFIAEKINLYRVHRPATPAPTDEDPTTPEAQAAARLSLRDTFIAEKGLWSEFAETVLHQQSSLEASGE